MHDLPVDTLRPLLLGVLAAALAWQANKILGRAPVKIRSALSPLAEEAAKTLPAALLSANIFFTHFFFGAVEGGWEMLSGRRNGFYAGLSALASHSVFGALTLLVYDLQGSLAASLAAGFLAHAAWNYAVVEFLSRRRRPGAGP